MYSTVMTVKTSHATRHGDALFCYEALKELQEFTISEALDLIRLFLSLFLIFKNPLGATAWVQGLLSACGFRRLTPEWAVTIILLKMDGQEYFSCPSHLGHHSSKSILLFIYIKKWVIYDRKTSLYIMEKRSTLQPMVLVIWKKVKFL